MKTSILFVVLAVLFSACQQSATKTDPQPDTSVSNFPETFQNPPEIRSQNGLLETNIVVEEKVIEIGDQKVNARVYNGLYTPPLGNSRAYLIRDVEMRQLTTDQTLAQVLMEIGKVGSHEITESAYKTLLQAAGNEPTVDIWQASFELASNDMLLVCSDGLTAQLAETEITQIIEDNAEHPKAAVTRLIEEANKHGGTDNITAIVAHFRHLE